MMNILAKSKTKKSNRVAITLLIVAASALVALAASAAPSRPAAPFAGLGWLEAPSIAERLAYRLDLSPEQRQAIRSLLEQRAPEIRDDLGAVKDSRLALFETIHTHPNAEIQVRDAAARVAEAEADLAVLRAELVTEVRGHLTADQLLELESLQDEAVLRVDRLATFLKMAVEYRLGV